ncbi:hypothetical protein RvY_14185 [Ramazzottius varieornatus]|uniref:Uncharacterized protein n=1 Tax=Ramazzottius varieornatus TaxID=947166 RepID=A0A1D1VSF6_RAMVA|nr:hypothetical protein RvY_14185 [Ramazzottius varieornatus]
MRKVQVVQPTPSAVTKLEGARIGTRKTKEKKERNEEHDIVREYSLVLEGIFSRTTAGAGQVIFFGLEGELDLRSPLFHPINRLSCKLTVAREESAGAEESWHRSELRARDETLLTVVAYIR